MSSTDRPALRALAVAPFVVIVCVVASVASSASRASATAISFADPPSLAAPPAPPSAPVLPAAITPKPKVFALGDLDGDGLPDVVGIESADSVLDVWRNLGGGTYAAPARYRLARYCALVALGDFDGDGRLDVAVGNQEFGSARPAAHAYSVLLNHGGGTLAPRVDGDLDYSPLDMVVADLGHDGHADLVFSIYGGFANGARVDVCRSRSDGSFAPFVPLGTGGPNDRLDFHPGTVVVGDLDGDGNLDILFGHSRTRLFATLAVFYGRSDAGFEDAMEYQTWTPSSQTELAPTAVVLQDIDADGLADVVVTVTSTGPGGGAHAVWLRNAGGRRLEAPSLREVVVWPEVLLAARLRPGVPLDLFVSDTVTVELLRNRGNGAFAPGVGVARGRLLAVADVNGDGFDDLVSQTRDSVEVRLADGAGGLLAPFELVGATGLGVGEFSGDHRPDLVLLLPSGDLALAGGDGAGHFGLPRDVGATGGLRAPWIVSDLDGDGIADLAWVGGNGIEDSLVVRWGTGSGFTAASQFDFGDRLNIAPIDLKTGDLNGDGRRDVTVVKGLADADPGVLRTLFGLGQRAFSPLSPAVSESGMVQQAVADFDQDGFDDVAFACRNQDELVSIHVLPGRADGAQSAQGRWNTETWMTSMTAGDFDGDGRADVAIGCRNWQYGSPSIVVMPNITPVQSPTPTLAALVSAEALPGAVTLLWDLGSSRVAAVSIERLAPGSDWAALAAVAPDGTGRVRYEDRTVVAGARYGYRLRLANASGGTALAEAWVDVPLEARFALAPNPARGSVEFALPSHPGAGRLEVVDLQGRVRWRRAVAAGETHARWSGETTAGGPLAPGLYWARWVTPGREQSRRLVWMR